MTSKLHLPRCHSSTAAMQKSWNPCVWASVQLGRLSPAWPWYIYLDSLCLSFLLLNSLQCFLPQRVVNETLKLTCQCLSHSKHLINISYSYQLQMFFYPQHVHGCFWVGISITDPINWVLIQAEINTAVFNMSTGTATLWHEKIKQCNASNKFLGTISFKKN